MENTISIIVYQIFSWWRAECKNCGTYSNASTNKISSAIINLNKNSTILTHKKCNHNYGSNNPRTIFYIDYKYLPSINEQLSFNITAPFMHIIIANRYDLTVINTVFSTEEIVESKKRTEQESKRYKFLSKFGII